MRGNIETYISNFFAFLGYIKISENTAQISKLKHDFEVKYNRLKREKEGCIADKGALYKKLEKIVSSNFQNQQKINELEKTINDLTLLSSKKENEIMKKNEEIEKLKKSPPVKYLEEAECPYFVDQEQEAYLPHIQWSGGGIRVNPRDVYTLSKTFVEWVFNEKPQAELLSMSKYDKAIYLWAKTVKARNYAYDSGDNWQTNFLSIKRELADCEDSTILMVTSCMVAGFKPNEIFNAVGPTSFGYHSYPIIYFSEDEIPNKVGGWYIFETTLSSSFAEDILKKEIPPKPLKGSKYKVDTLANWNFAGAVKKDYEIEFNG